MKTFLTAEWRKLVMANYLVQPEILKSYLPDGTELDFFQGRCYISLVGFNFVNTRIGNIAIPFHRDFEEVNLRFYVRSRHKKELKRGVVFIKEIVPKFAITWVANSLYGEKYETMQMGHVWAQDEKSLSVKYLWKKNNWNSVEVNSSLNAFPLVAGTEAEFMTEHFWGYTRLKTNVTSEYEVVHPSWNLYPVNEYKIEVNFEEIYGENFGFLSRENPYSVFLAEGSEIEVKAGQTIFTAGNSHTTA
jgi:uncharacterized protein